jgi:Predicted periplasmic solute-binding protein
MVRVSAIPYLNTVPFVYGLKQQVVREHIELGFAVPSLAAHQLQHGLCDLSIVSVAAIPSLEHANIISSYCIGAVGKVDSVLLCSRKPMEQIKEVALDTESRTSVMLMRILAREYWQIAPNYRSLQACEGQNLPESAVLIGDKALIYGPQYPYVYDLAQAWQAHTALPFVFAAWVANTSLSQEFIALFNEALSYGVSHITEALEQLPGELPVLKAQAQAYLTQCISYEWDAEKQKGLQLFLEKLKTINC